MTDFVPVVNRRQGPKFFGFGVILFFIFVFFVLPAFYSSNQFARAASAPAIITYQGKVLDSSGVAVTSSLNMKFVLYDSSSGGTALYTASGTLGATSSISVTPVSGLFSVNLGGAGTNALDPTIFQNNQDIYLEVNIGGETLSPRKQITASPYSYNSKYLDGIAATSTASSSTYIPISDSNGNFNFNFVTSTGLAVLDGTILASGTGGGTPSSGAGTRLMWIPIKAAFRAGTIDGTQWDDVNIGLNSVAFGDNNIASGTYSAAVGGQNNTAGNWRSFVGGGANNNISGQTSFIGGGQNHILSGDNSFIGGGAGNNVSGDYSFAAGISNAVSGVGAAAFGSNMEVSGEGSFGIGLNGSGAYLLSASNTFAVVGGNSLFGTTTELGYTVGIDGSFGITGTSTFATATISDLTITGSCVGCGGGGVSTTTANTWTALNDFNGGITWTNATGTSLILTNTLNVSGTSTLATTTISDLTVTNLVSSTYFNASSSTSGYLLGGSLFASMPSPLTVSIGLNSGGAFSPAYENTFVGVGAGQNVGLSGDGDGNAAFGYLALNLNQAYSNSAFGSYALQNSTSGYNNTAVGNGALANDSSGSRNIGIGINSGSNNFTGDYNTFIGDNAGVLMDGLSNATAIGKNSFVGQSNALILGGTGVDAVSVGIGTATPAFTLDVLGTLGISGTSTLATTTVSSSLLSVINGAIMASGTTGATPGSGGGTRLMWVPSKGAFRAGTVVSDEWDDSNIGVNSAAFGAGSIASGLYSFAQGSGAQATATNSVAFGLSANASGAHALALGNSAAATNDWATAIGMQAQALATQTMALGTNVTASAIGAVALGSNLTAGGITSLALGSYVTVNGTYSAGLGLDGNPRTLTANNTFAVLGGNSLFGTTTAHSYQVYIDSGASTSPGLGVNGYIEASGFITPSTTVDLAEQYPINPACAETNSCPEAGDAVCLVSGFPATIEKCSVAYSPKAVGIISTNPGFTLGGLNSSTTRKVALAGRVPLKILPSTSVIHVGDRLTTSDVPGYAQKATAPGPAIAIAAEDYPSVTAAPETITAFVNNSWAFPTEVLDSTTTPETFTGGFWNLILGWFKQFGIQIENGILRVKEFFADKVHTQILCVGDTCVDENRLKILLDNSLLSPIISAPSSGPTLPPSSPAPTMDSSTISSTTVTASTTPDTSSSSTIDSTIIIDTSSTATNTTTPDPAPALNPDTPQSTSTTTP